MANQTPKKWLNLTILTIDALFLTAAVGISWHLAVADDAPRWQIKVLTSETGETRHYRLGDAAAQIPALPGGIQCRVSEAQEADDSLAVHRMVACKNLDAQAVHASVPLRCLDGDDTQVTLEFRTSFYDTQECHESIEDRLQKTICLPATSDQAVKIQLSCDWMHLY